MVERIILECQIKRMRSFLAFAPFAASCLYFLAATV